MTPRSLSSRTSSIRFATSLLFATATLVVSPLIALSPEASPTGDAHRAEVEAFRKQRVEALTKEDGWLSVAGLFFLKPGLNSVGSDRASDVVLPAAAPKRLGSFEFKDGRVSVTLDEPKGVTINAEPAARSAELKPAAPGKPADMVRLGTLTMFVHMSGERTAIRLRDSQSALRRDFKGTRWYDVDPSYRVTARVIRDKEPSTVQVPNILGDAETYRTEGVVEFTLHGQQLKMRPMWTSERLFFIMRDATSGKETYSASRFLYADLPKDGTTVLDFNKAHNPPCAFNPYTTCPLPPKENRLTIRIEAGEKAYDGAHAPATAVSQR